jgi:serine/threonine protein kinase/formylglycine-generating enzyme required for sulfatase activity
MSAPASSSSSLLADPTLRDVPVIEGCKVLGGVALYGKVGQGGMGIVYRGRHCVLGVDMAVKVLKPSLAAEDERFALRFLREAKAAARVSHQHVVRLYDASQHAGLHYLVMEYVDGENLRGRVQRKGALAEGEALGLLLGAAQGLAEAHRAGMVHRDVKPDNVLVARDGRVKVADLGLVRRDDAALDSVSLGSGLMGTPQYMPPEQFDTPDVGPAADVWALGACLWFLLTGDHPFEVTSLAAAARRVQDHDFPTLRERRPDVRPEVHAVFERCVRRRAQERFPDARALVEALLPLQPWPESALADDAAGTRSSAALPTPPPRATLDRIRDVLATTTAAAGSDARRSEAPTIPSPGTTVPPSPVRARRQRGLAMAAAALVAAGALGWYGHEHGWFGPSSAEWDDAEKLVRARGLVERAEELLPQPGTLAEVVAKLDEALALRPDFARAKPLLALALERRASERARLDPDEAFGLCKRAVELDPDNAEAQARRKSLELELTTRLMLGLRIRQPAELAVSSSPRVVVTGTVPERGDVRRVKVTMTPRAAPDAARSVEATVAGGTFTATFDAPPGEVAIHVEATDRHGLHTTAAGRGFTVAGVVGGDRVDPAAPDVTIHTLAGIPMASVRARSFTMGSNMLELGRDEDELQHEVTLTEPFWLGQCETTRRQWALVMGTTPWPAADGGATDEGPDERPATDVTWHDAVRFCERLTELERDAGRVPDGYRYCLPSEAQWELAAHGDGYRKFVHGDQERGLDRHAVFGGGDAPQRVGSRKQAPAGFVDLAGNVAEWCADHADGESRVTTDTWIDGAVEPLSANGANRVVRGGRFGSPAADCRNAARVALPPGTARVDVGFRVALAKR